MNFQAALSHGLLFAFAAVFVGGLLTALTPCVYPLIPITVSIFGARQASRRSQAALLCATYVLGIALTYTALGVVAGATGHAFGRGISGNPWVIGPIVLLFVAFALAMFGAFELQLPSSLQQRLTQVGGKGYLGALLMGLVAGLIAAPCTGPVLGAVLTFVSTRGSVALGGSLLFVYALGMGLPFFVIGTFAIALPKSGAWMDAVKSVFGVTMLVVALYFGKQILSVFDVAVPQTLAFRAGAVVAALVAVAAGAIHLSFHGSWAQRVRKALATLVLVTAGHALVQSFTTTTLEMPTYSVERWQSEGEGLLARARAEKRPVLIDFGASWCPACKELERETYPDRKVVAELRRFLALKIDDRKSTLVEQFGGPGLPYIVFYDSEGRMRRELNQTGFVTPDQLVQILKTVN
jgi:thiol:disulfide interchange protein DsbD